MPKDQLTKMPKKSHSKVNVKKASKKLSRQGEDKSTEIVSHKSSDVNNLTTSDIFRLADLHFNKRNYIFRHLYDSYNKFIEEDVKNFLEFGDNVFTETMTSTTYYRYRFSFNKIRVLEPVLENGVEPMFPSDARYGNQTYSLKLIADVTQYQDVIDIATNERVVNQVGEVEMNVPIASIPLMLRSKWCSLTTHKNMDKNECEYDAGGYFIVNGNEKVVIAQDRMIENKAMVFVKKDSGALSLIAQVNSKSYKPNGMTQVVAIKIKKDNIMTIRAPILNEINVFILLRALGLESDRDIINYTVYDEHDIDMVDLAKVTLDNCKNEKGVKIQTQQEAIDYLITKMRVLGRYTETDKDTKLIQKKMHLMSLLQNSLLPHVEGQIIDKAYFIGRMINKLLKVSLGRAVVDDRDSYVNKRIDLPGDLMFELFKQQFKKMLGECKKFFDNRNKDNTKPLNVINYIKPNTIEQGLKASLSTGNWIRRQGVAQMLQRLTYLQTIGFLRRVDAPGGDASSAKLTGPRHLHPSTVGFLCVTGDTEILMSDNATVKLIKDIRNGDSVMTTYKNDLSEIPSPMTNWFSRKADDILEITTISGRKLKCTSDHPLLTRQGKEYVMVKAGELKEGDQVIVRHTQKYLPLDKEMDVVIKASDVKNDKYLDGLRSAGLIDRKLKQDVLEITARLIGASITDGNVCVKEPKGKVKSEMYSASFNLGEERDALDVFDDIQKLGFGSSSIAQRRTKFINKDNGKHTIYNTWCVTKGGEFAYYLQLMGAFVGRKTDQERGIPEWIKNGNSRIQREFLSGFQGGDGCRISMQHNVTDFKLRLGRTEQTTFKIHQDATVAYMTDIKNMFEKFGIESNVGTYKADTEDKIRVYVSFSVTYKNIARYADIIGYRYCNEKRRTSAAPIEYIKYKTLFAEEKQSQYDEIIRLTKEKKTPAEIQKLTGIELKFIQRIRQNLSKNKCPVPRETDDDVMKYDKFKSEYYIDNLNLAVPIGSIKKLEGEVVYDFTTRFDTHTFTANGIISSNCVSQTPEHSKVGLTKHLSLVGSITIMSRDQYSILKDYLYGKVTRVSDTPARKLREHTTYKVFLNGDWIGTTDKYVELETQIEQMRLSGEFDQKNVSLVADHEDGELRVYCDSGRLVRPVLRVVDNVVQLNKKHIESISLNKINKGTKVTEWEEFLTKYQGVIEYIDMELQPYVIVADTMAKVEKMRVRAKESIEKVKDVKSKHCDNRYDEMFFVKYTHCEIHPSLLLGELSAGIPFCDHNPGSRNIFQYSQGRQALGLYATNYGLRFDISYILYGPQKALVTTRASKYTNSQILPSGTNTTVAIATYTGYNQEDSLIFNRTSIERGKFRGMYLKKYIVSVQKNQSTSQDDIFMKPDPNKILGKKDVSYDKLNDRGFVPEETVVVNGDVLMGKVTPISDANNTGKQFKDSSEGYKMHAPGVVDRVCIGIQNQDGYEIRKMLVRSERIPRIGDKYCLTKEAEVLTDKGWIGIADVTVTHKVATLVNGEIQYVHPLNTFQRDYAGQMYKLRSQQVDLDVTTDHQLYVKKRDHREFELIDASKVIGKRVHFKKDCLKSGDDVKTKIINGKEYDMDAFIELLGIFIADGTMCDDENIMKEFEPLNVEASAKFLPEWVWELNQRQSRLLLECLLAGDVTQKDAESCVTVSRQLADDIMKLAVHSGYSGLIDTRDDKYYVQILKINNDPQINYDVEGTHVRQSEELYDYDGKVYCLEVPSHVFMVRQNKKNVWVGNCCYDDQTEVLTDKGWIFFKDLTKAHKVASLINGKQLIYQDPLVIQSYDYNGKMYKIESNQVDLVVTPNHRMYINRRGPKGFRIETANKIYGQTVFYKKNAEIYVPDKSKYAEFKNGMFVLPEWNDRPAKLLNLDAWLEFFGIWMAEGWKHQRTTTFAGHKQRVKDSLRKCCKIMGFKLCENQGRPSEHVKNIFCINDIQLATYMGQFSVGAINKFLPKWVWGLTQRECRVLINGMMLGDGHQMKKCSTRRYDTSSTKLANDFQRLCLHAGYATNIAVKYEAGHTSTIVKGERMGETITSTTDAYRMAIIETQLEPKVNKNKYKGQMHDSWVQYKGKVYCCTVMGNGPLKELDGALDTQGVIYVRRNKVPVWSCNSQHGQKGTIGILLQGADMPFTERGIQPDIILNPNAIPSRMTIGQLVECLVGKVAALEGMDADGTPFEEHNIEAVKARLKSLGYNENGCEYMYNGMTGERMKTMIFIGPTYYQRLKHLVEDKIHCLSMDHEVLTEEGWKTYDELSMKDKVACLVDNKLVYQNPTNLLYYPDYKGDMYHIETQQIDLMVTPEHRMWVSENDNNFGFELAKDIIGKMKKYQTSVDNTCEGIFEVNNEDSEQVEEIIKDYNKPVFCLEVPSEVFYVRRNGKACWTGNSRARGPRTLLTRQAPEGRSREGGLRLGKPILPKSGNANYC